MKTGKRFAFAVILFALLGMGWFAMHKRPHHIGPLSAASRAENMCEQAVRLKAPHPASVNFREFGSQPPTNMQGGGYQVRLAFDEKDALGDTMAEMAICTVKGGKLRSFKEPRP